MSYNGSGTFNINTAGQPVVTGTTITSTAFNLLTADLATGLSTALTKDGQTTPTANIPLGGFKITSLGAGTAATDAAQYGQLQAGATTIATVTGTDTYVGTLTPAIAAYATGNLFSFVAPNTNTGAATINLNSLGAKNITKLGSTALAAGDIVSGRVYQIEYDGTRFQLLNPSASSVASFSAGSTGFTPSSATTGAVTLAGTLATTNGGTGLTSFTANGLLYASSSSALATGSALTYNGSTFKVAGSDASLIAGFSGTTKGIRIETTSTGSSIGGVDSTLVNSFEPLDINGSYTTYSTSGTERMRLTSTGLGIGTSSPTRKLSIGGSSSAVMDFYATSYRRFAIGSESRGFVVYDDTASAYRMEIDASGNLGLGVTPSAWYSGYAPVFENKGGTIVSPNTTQLQLFANAYLNSSVQWVRRNAGYAAYYNIGAGAHEWYIAGTSSAGSTISWTQAMTLDASGNLGVGTTSPAAKLNISGGDAYFYNTATYGGIRIGYDGSNYWSIQRENASTGRLGFFNGASEKVSIDASGNMGIGTTSPINFGAGITTLEIKGTNGTYGGYFIATANGGATQMQLAGENGVGYVGTRTNHPVYFLINNTERMRLDTSGNLLVNTTTSNAKLTVYGASGVAACYFKVNTDNDAAIFFANAANSIVGQVQVTNVATVYLTSSDYRLKNNITPMTGALAKVSKLKPVTYKWNVDGSDGEGFIAHELAEVCPQAVSGGKDAVDENGNPKHQGIDTSFLIATLTAAIQEQQTIIESLKARLDAANL